MEKFTDRERAYLATLGYEDKEISTVENGEYKYFSNYGRQVTKECAIRRLGKKPYLLGIARAMVTGAHVANCKRDLGTITIRRV